MTRPPRRILAVSEEGARAELLGALLADAFDHERIVLESVRGAYSRVRQLPPDLVILFVGSDDVAACQLLSMLKLDPATSGIPIVTWAARAQSSEFTELVAGVTAGPWYRRLVVMPN